MTHKNLPNTNSVGVQSLTSIEYLLTHSPLRVQARLAPLKDQSYAVAHNQAFAQVTFIIKCCKYENHSACTEIV